MAKALTLHQPWASLVALGVKTVETRSWATSYRGRLLIHAGRRMTYGPIGVYGVKRYTGEPLLLFPYGPMGRAEVPLPLGAVVASCTLADCVPIVGADGCKDATKHLCIVNESMLLHSALDEPWPDGETEHIVSGEQPYGDFAPGRWAWLLEDVKPTTDRCPACWGCGYAAGPDDYVSDGPLCTICGGDGWGRGTPAPLADRVVPARGAQRLWEWPPVPPTEPPPYDRGREES